MDIEHATTPELLGELAKRHNALICVRIDFNRDVLFDCFGGTITGLGLLARATHMIQTGFIQMGQRADGDGEDEQGA